MKKDKLIVGDFMEYFTIFFRSVLFYVLIATVYRVMGKREIGELSIMDFIVSIFIAEIAAISIENYKKSILVSLIPISVLVALQIGASVISLKNGKIRNAIDGMPSVIINRGRVNFEEMLKQRYNLDDLLTQLRDKEIKSIEEVDYAILETSGRLSVFKKQDDKKHTYPLPVIIDGEEQEDVLYQIGKNKVWLLEVLRKEGKSLENVFYAFYRDKRLFIIEKDKLTK